MEGKGIVWPVGKVRAARVRRTAEGGEIEWSAAKGRGPLATQTRWVLSLNPDGSLRSLEWIGDDGRRRDVLA